MNTPRPPAASLVAVAVLMTASCTAGAHGGSADAPPAGRSGPGASAERDCTKGEFRWGRIEQRDVLAAVSDPLRVRIAAGRTRHTRLTLLPLRSMRATVSPSGRLTASDAEAAVAALERRTGLPLARTGTAWTLEDGDKVSDTEGTGPYEGVMVASVGVRLVEAPFTRTCSGTARPPVRGTVATWSTVPFADLLTCGLDEPLPAVTAQAEALVCGDGIRAGA
ncbi:hypothetical protein [Actinacidiphila glaucinigra]|uniref:Lipoprotein n=1 Tax=Actinacidiphila glaucinigra TaxID=235986 RepID=A0A239MV89_9ACTN|nr:hypothetical protein [Actinacidiphila glaucinigra]SNT46666.1 hypothetical protein SAMN05216252_12841 [Actinacidiphila glaucinigra]